MILDGKAPTGDIEEAWDKHRFSITEAYMVVFSFLLPGRPMTLPCIGGTWNSACARNDQLCQLYASHMERIILQPFESPGF